MITSRNMPLGGPREEISRRSKPTLVRFGMKGFPPCVDLSMPQGRRKQVGIGRATSPYQGGGGPITTLVMGGPSNVLTHHGLGGLGNLFQRGGIMLLGETHLEVGIPDNNSGWVPFLCS